MAAGLTLGAVSSAQAAFPGANGKIAFEVFSATDAGFQGDIHTVNADGTGLVNLTTSDSQDVSPDFSPDGTRIAFISDRSGQSGLYVMNADGTSPALVPNTLGVAYVNASSGVSWSPDGTRIVFDAGVRLNVINADGTGLTAIGPTGVNAAGLSGPEWSPDGTRIAFHSDHDTAAAPEIYTMNPDGTGLTRLTSNTTFDATPDWSPDGATIVWNSNSGTADVSVMNADGTSPQQLVNTAGANPLQPVFSPDGTRIAYGSSGAVRSIAPDDTSDALIQIAPGPISALDWQPLEQVEPPELAPLEVSKTAEPTYTVRHRWDIDKWASTKAGWDAEDSSLAVRYTVRVRHEVGDAYGIAVSGDIRIHNPNDVAVPLSDVDDSTEGATSCTTGAGPTVPANGTVYVPYTCNFDSLPGGVVTNTASVYWNDGQANQVATAQVPVDFGAARVYNDNAWVKVTDTLDGDKTRTLAKHLDRSRTFTYTGYLKAWPGKCRVWHNTARLIGYEHADGGPTNGVPIEPQTDLRVGMDGDDYAFTKTAQEWVKVCAPPDPPKDDPTVDPKPPTVIVGGDKPGPQPVRIVDADNPKGPVVKDPTKSRGTLRVHKRSSERRARVGDTVIWSIRVANTGKADLTRVRLLDKLPRHLVVATTGQVSSGRAVKSTKRRIRIAVGDLAVGQKRTYRIATRVVARPKVTPKVVASAKKLNSRARKVLLKRSKRGIVCNKVMANAPDTRAAFSTACVRIVRAPVVVPPPA